MQKEKNEGKVNSKTAYKMLAKNKKLLEEYYVKISSTNKVKGSSDSLHYREVTDTIAIDKIDKNRIVKKSTFQALLNEVVKNNELTKQHGKVRTSVVKPKGIDQNSLSAFDPPITTYPSQVGYNNSRTREVVLPAIPIAAEPPIEEQRAASSKYRRLNRKKRKRELITKEDELTDKEKIALYAYNRNQREGKFVIPISLAPEPPVEEQRAANLKYKLLNKKKQKGQFISKEDELTDKEKIAIKAYHRNQYINRKIRNSKGLSKRRKRITKV